MTRIKTSKWPTALFAGLAVALLSSAASAKNIKSKTVDCSVPGETLANALSNTSSDRVDEIVFTGTCIEGLTITKDDVTVRGADGTAEIQGQINIDGARRVSLRDFIFTAAGRLGVYAFDGAAIVIDNVDISGAAESNISIYLNASAKVRNSMISGGGSENIDTGDGANLNIKDSFIENAGRVGILVGKASTARIQKTSFTGNGNLALAVGFGSMARLRGGGSDLAPGTDGAIAVSEQAILVQGAGHDTITGDIFVGQNSYARVRDANIIGDIYVEQHSGLSIADQSTSATPTLTGSVFIAQDSYAELRGNSPMEITGSVSCNDDESSLHQLLPVNVTVTGGVSCTGF